jgi:hypothetical protein
MVKSEYNTTMSTKKRKRAGRLPKNPAEKFSAFVGIKMLAAEKAALAAEARRAGVTVSAYLMAPFRGARGRK